MSEILRDFGVNVATDPELAMRFSTDPNAELDRVHLTTEERTILLERDSARLRELLGAPRKGNANVVLKKKKKKGIKKKGTRKPAARKMARVRRAR